MTMCFIPAFYQRLGIEGGILNSFLSISFDIIVEKISHILKPPPLPKRKRKTPYS